MSVRAQWHLADLVLEDDDSDPMSDLLNLGKPIDLSEGRASLNARFQSLVKQESRIYEQTGTECDLKYEAGHSCLTCPQFTDDPEAGPMFSVCRIGREQFSILAQLNAHKEIEELEALAFRRMLEDECDELAEAMLPV